MLELLTEPDAIARWAPLPVEPVGEFTAVMGPSGRGKSTLIHIRAEAA